MIRLYVALAAALLLGSCSSNSLLYSPSINLPAEPLEKKDIQLGGSVGLLPETRPEKDYGGTSAAGEIYARYALTKDFTLQARSWVDFSRIDEFAFERGGYSFSALMVINARKRSAVTVGLMPTYGNLVNSNLDGNTYIEGYGVSLPVVMWFNTQSKVKPYSSVAFLYGVRNGDKQESPIDGTFRLQDGWALTTNLGMNYPLSDRVAINAELVPLYQYNRFEEIGHFLLSANAGLSFTL